MRNRFLSTVAINSIRIRAFDPGNSFPVALPGQANMGMIQSLINAALTAGNQQQITSEQEDLSARDIDSAWMLDYWNLTDDLIAGYKAVKARGEKHLPRFADEPQNDFNARLEQTEMTNIYSDVVETLASKPFEEEVTLKQDNDANGKPVPLPEPIDSFVKDVDGAGNSLTAFSAVTFFNGINSAIHWIYVDYPKVNPSVTRTQQDMKDQGIRPFWSHVLGRNVLQAKSQIINGKETLIRMRILEPGMPYNNIRVFERSTDGTITMGLFEERVQSDGKSKLFILIDSATITIGEIPLVPFATGRRDGRSFKYFPAMRAAADCQIELYQQESGLKWAKVMTAYPMLAANGINPVKGPDGNPKKLAVGPNVVLYSQRDGTSGNFGSWAYVSPDAACLTFLKEDVKETMDQLRELGRQPLTAQSGNLTVITTAVAAGKSRSAVGAWTMGLKLAIENAMRLTCKWLAISEDDFEPCIQVYDDFDDFSTDQGSDHSALQFARTNGVLSRKNYIAELKRRNTIRPDMDEEENDRQLLEETPDDSANPNAQDDTGGNLPEPKDPKNPQPGEKGYKKKVPTA